MMPRWLRSGYTTKKVGFCLHRKSGFLQWRGVAKWHQTLSLQMSRFDQRPASFDTSVASVTSQVTLAIQASPWGTLSILLVFLLVLLAESGLLHRGIGFPIEDSHQQKREQHQRMSLTRKPAPAHVSIIRAGAGQLKHHPRQKIR